MNLCNVCHESLNYSVYSSEGGCSLTSMSQLVSAPTKVYFCKNCGHTQTPETFDEKHYYDSNYNILTDSREEDQIYEIKNGEVVYRTQHQLRTLLSKVDLNGKKILDYGCAKGAVIRRLLETDETVDAFLYDVSETYKAFWDEFTSEDKCATYSFPASWISSFDIVTSFFSLEHITRLDDALVDIRSLLREEGLVYVVIPNVQANIADLVVADHPNHFTCESLTYLFSKAGFRVQTIDENSHRGAFIVIAKKDICDHFTNINTENLFQKIETIGNFWMNARERIQQFERRVEGCEAAIYGAGFYGAYILSALKSPEKIRVVLDNNKYLHGRRLMDSLVIDPAAIPGNIEALYIGLNPASASDILKSQTVIDLDRLQCFYL